MYAIVLIHLNFWLTLSRWAKFSMRFMYNEILLTIRCDLPEGKGCCEPQAIPGNCSFFFIFQRCFCLGGLHLNLCITGPDWCVESQLCAHLIRVKVRILTCFKTHLHTRFSPKLYAGSCKFSMFNMGVPGNIMMSDQPKYDRDALCLYIFLNLFPKCFQPGS